MYGKLRLRISLIPQTLPFFLSKMATFSLARYAAEILSSGVGGMTPREATLSEFRKCSLIPIKPFKYPGELPSTAEFRRIQYTMSCEFLSPTSLAVFKEVRFVTSRKVHLLHPSGAIYTVCIAGDGFPHAISKDGLPLEMHEKKWHHRMSVLDWLLLHIN